jgi:hypothetical protein
VKFIPLSLTPGFSRVSGAKKIAETVSTVFGARVKTVQTVFDSARPAFTLLKRGVNERNFEFVL